MNSRNHISESDILPMISNQDKTSSLYKLLFKCIAISSLFFISILIIACSSSGTTQLNPGTPVVTVTINLEHNIGSPTPTLSPFYCGGWATDTSPAYSSNSTVNVFGKFTMIKEGNPQGIGGASATATISWPDGTVDTQTTTTTSDGLAVFPVVIKPSAINKLVTISIVFSSPKNTCTIQRPAYFTPILVSPTPNKTASPSAPGTPTGPPIPVGSGTPTLIISPKPTH